MGIVVGSTIKGLIAGILIGYFAKKFNSLPLGIVFGLAVGLLLAFAVAAMPSENGEHYYFEIMLPGASSDSSSALPLRSTAVPLGRRRTQADSPERPGSHSDGCPYIALRRLTC